jgi:YggT family protein
MREVISLLDILLDVARSASGALLIICAILAGLAWAVRARKVSPFGPMARFVRRAVEPLLTPIDRRMARHGIIGTNVPWWALLFVLLACAALIFAIGFVRDALLTMYLAANSGPRGLVVLAIRAIFGTLQLALLVRVVTSWIGGTYSAIGRLALRLTEWFLSPLRSALPAMGGIDISPLIAWLALSLIQSALLRVL